MSDNSSETQPCVSVIVPTHNRPVLLEQAVRSVLDGEFTDVEIVVSNNGRPEDTRELTARIDDPRLRCIEQAQDLPRLENFLSPLAAARGRYVAVLHDDDYFDPRYLATLIPPLEARPDAVLAFTDPWHVDPSGEVDLATTEFFSQLNGRAHLATGYYQPFGDLVVNESIWLPGLLFRRSALSLADFHVGVGAAHDKWIGYLLAITGGAAYYTRERLVYYRVHDEREFVSDPLVYYNAALYCDRHMLKDPRMGSYHAALSRRSADRQFWVGKYMLRNGRRNAARGHLAKANRLRPTMKSVAAWGATCVLPSSVLTRL